MSQRTEKNSELLHPEEKQEFRRQRQIYYHIKSITCNF